MSVMASSVDTADALSGGFVNPPIDAAVAFRHIMQAMARPGTLRRVSGATPPAPLSVAAGTLVLTLCDADTPLCLLGDNDCEPVRQWVTFHTGAPLTDAANCQFAVGAWQDMLPLSRFPTGTPEYPDRSATLIIECGALTNSGARLQGPGICNTASLSLPAVDEFVANHSLYPLGLDFFFTCEQTLAALPRSTIVSSSGETI